MILDGFFHLFNPILDNEISWYLFCRISWEHTVGGPAKSCTV